MFNKRIKEEREYLKLTQKELAEKIDVTPATIGLYEQGRRTPDYETLIKIADILNVTVDYLLGRTNNKSEKIQKPDEYTNIIIKAKGAKIPAKALDDYIEFLQNQIGKKN